MSDDAKTPTDTPSGNADYSWEKFDTEAYFTHYYRELHADDIDVIQRTVRALNTAAPQGQELNIIDVGTGPNVFPLFAAMPRAKKMTVWEFAPTNIAWLKAELHNPEMRRQLSEFWGVTREAWGLDLPDHPYPAILAKTELLERSIFDLPERTWDAATMFFCADFITQQMEEFERACTAFARCVKSGGTICCAFLLNSGGYEVADRPFPVLKLTSEDVKRIFDKLATEIDTAEIGIVEEEIRSGYLGMLFLTAKVK